MTNINLLIALKTKYKYVSLVKNVQTQMQEYLREVNTYFPIIFWQKTQDLRH